MKRFISQLVKTSGDLIIDIGCYDGYFIDEIFDKDCQFIGFEPNPSKCANLKIKYSVNNNIIIECLALGGFTGSCDLYLMDSSSSFFKEWNGSNDKVKVSVKKLSEYLNGKIPEIIKINCEGAEYAILDDLIDNDILPKIKQILVQFHKIDSLYNNHYERLQGILGKYHKKIYSYKTWELWRS